MNSRMLLLWLAGGAGVILLYAAYKGESPTHILEGYASSKTTAPHADTQTVASGSGSQSSGNHPVASDFIVTDSNGNSVDVPPAYSSNPDLFIPSRNMN